MKKKMFYGAGKLIFEKAKQRRNHLTQSELIFWTKLKERYSMFRFRRQHPLRDYIADFYCRSVIRFTNEDMKLRIEDCLQMIGQSISSFTEGNQTSGLKC